ncbi:MAG: anthranilate synthase component I [Eubacteriales bacterium]|nr:anthranilate synthase component I [Eubacteriales bacterium]
MADHGLPIFPERGAFLELAKQYRIVPVSVRMPADTVTPISLFQRFDDQKQSFLLESVVGGERWARFSIMGRKPLLRLTSRRNIVHYALSDLPLQAYDSQHPLDLIRQLLQDHALPPAPAEEGFRCGLVGHFSYDFVRYLEVLPDNNPDPLNLPDCELMAPAEVVRYDHLKNEMTLICNCLISDDPARDYNLASAQLFNLINQLFGPQPGNLPVALPHASRRSMQLDFKANVTHDEFVAQVQQAKAYIREGDIFQVVLSQRFSAAYKADPFAIYRALRHVNPSPYLFFVRQSEAVLIGASPEMLVRLSGRRIETCPIAGTRPRGQTVEQDDQFSADLLADTKELAEHAMLVDLARNDVGRISQFGTVAVRDFCHVERFSHVMHLVTTVEGELREDRAAIDVLSSLLPAGTLSGAPKIRAMEIIDELENVRRGPYGGAIGYLGFDGLLDTCITIRTAILRDGQIHVQSGAGIVADSVPETEYQETVNKAMALFAAINQAGDYL